MRDSFNSCSALQLVTQLALIGQIWTTILGYFDTTSFRQPSIGKPSIRQPSVGQPQYCAVSWSTRQLANCKLVNSVSWSTPSIGQTEKKLQLLCQKKYLRQHFGQKYSKFSIIFYGTPPFPADLASAYMRLLCDKTLFTLEIYSKHCSLPIFYLVMHCSPLIYVR